jgi:hypothetical protein
MIDEPQEVSAEGAIGVSSDLTADLRIAAASQDKGGLVRVAEQADVPAKAQFAAEQVSYINSYISLADTKAAWVFAIPAAVLAYLSAQQEVWTLLTSPGSFGAKALTLITVFLLLVSAAAGFAVIVPRLGGSTGGVVYFGAVASRKSAGDYLANLAPLTQASLVNARLHHSFELARVCRRKYHMLQVAMWSGVTALMAMLVLVSVLKISEPVHVVKAVGAGVPNFATSTSR